MTWEIRFAKQAVAFLDTNSISEETIVILIREALKKFQGEVALVDIKKMKGKWAGHHRIRKGKWRVVVEFNFDNRSVFIEVIDWRGNIY